MDPKDKDAPARKTKMQMANVGRRRTDRANTICPFHHPSNGRGIKNIYRIPLLIIRSYDMEPQ